ncbi:MAG: hypothetical protein IPN86_21970 [Saprospiraceae bacterium]|nr:hypothetical protein [Saprospiraceae bacterium]
MKNDVSHLDSFLKTVEEIKGGSNKQICLCRTKKMGTYITRYEEGKEYPIHSRKKDNSRSTPEEIMLNVNDMAKGYEYYMVGGRTVGPDNKILAYSEDTVSRRQYTVRFKDLVSGNNLSDVIS